MARVRLFAVLRELADTSTTEAAGETVEQVVRSVCDRYGDRFTRIARRSTVAVNGERASLDAAVGPSDEVAILPPVSGG